MVESVANLYKKNCMEFCKRKAFGVRVCSYLDRIEPVEDAVKVVDGIPYFKENGEYYRMRSENQIEEAERLMRDIDLMKDYFLVVYGIGNPHLLRRLVKDTATGTRIFIIEKNPYIIKYMFAHENLTDVLTSNKTVFVHGDDELIGQVAIMCMNSSWDNLAQNLQVVSMPYFHLYGEFRANSLKKINKTILMNLDSLGNSLSDVIRGLENNYWNVDAAIKANGIDELRGKFEGVPGIIVSAGPSLDKNIELLKEVEGKAVIITTDAAYRACERVGVRPDAIASIERERPTYEYFYMNKKFPEDMVLVGPSLLYPDILLEYPGKQVLMGKTETGIDGWWKSFFSKMEYVMQGFSCANTAHAVLMEMGCDPIILIGQDFALTGNKRHSEDSKYFKNNETKELTKDNWKYWTEDIHGNPVPTTETFNLFRQTMEEMILADTKTVIDATEGGAKIDSTKIMTFREAIDTYCTQPVPGKMCDYLEDIRVTDKDYLDKYDQIVEAIDVIIEDLDEVLDRIRQHCEIINPYGSLDFESLSQEQLIDIVLNMQKGNEIIDYMVGRQKNLITYYQQILKQTVIYVKKIGNEVTPKTVKRNWELQLHLMFLMEVTTRVIEREYKKAKEFIVNKKKERMEESA